MAGGKELRLTLVQAAELAGGAELRSACAPLRPRPVPNLQPEQTKQENKPPGGHSLVS
jgi:hypothetical protein